MDGLISVMARPQVRVQYNVALQSVNIQGYLKHWNTLKIFNGFEVSILHVHQNYYVSPTMDMPPSPPFEM